MTRTSIRSSATSSFACAGRSRTTPVDTAEPSSER
jgi:hypothetical protein